MIYGRKQMLTGFHRFTARVVFVALAACALVFVCGTGSLAAQQISGDKIEVVCLSDGDEESFCNWVEYEIERIYESEDQSSVSSYKVFVSCKHIFTTGEGSKVYGYTTALTKTVVVETGRQSEDGNKFVDFEDALMGMYTHGTPRDEFMTQAKTVASKAVELILQDIKDRDQD